MEVDLAALAPSVRSAMVGREADGKSVRVVEVDKIVLRDQWCSMERLVGVRDEAKMTKWSSWL